MAEQKHVIKISGDFKELEKNFGKVKKELKGLSKDGIDLKLSPDAKKLFSAQQAHIIKGLTTEIKASEKEVDKLAKAYVKTGVGLEKYNQAIQKNAQLSRQFKQAGGTVGGAGGGAGGVVGALGLSRFAGAAAPAAIAAAALAAGAYSYSRSQKYAKPGLIYEGLGYDRDAVRRQVVGPGSSNMYNREESMGMGIGWARASGGLGGLGLGMQVARGFGMDFDQVSGIAGTARRGGGNEGSQRKAFIDMMAAGVASGVGDARLPEYMQAQTALLSGFMQSGPANIGFLSNLLSTVTSKGGSFARNNPNVTAGVMNKLSAGYMAQGRGGNMWGVMAPRFVKEFGAKGAHDIEVISGFGVAGAGPQLGEMNLPPKVMKGYRDLGLLDKGAGDKAMNVIYGSIFGDGKRNHRQITGATRSMLGGGASSSDVASTLELLHTWQQNKGTKIGDAAREEFDKQLKEKNKTVQDSMDGSLTTISKNVSAILDLARVGGISQMALTIWEKVFGDEAEGANSGRSGKKGKSGLRTDRHNNPTALTVALAKQAGLVAGVDYEVGEPFTDEAGRTYRTARFLGNAYEGTTKLIDRVGFHTQAGKPRWLGTEYTDEEWRGFSTARKHDIISQMSQIEKSRDFGPGGSKNNRTRLGGVVKSYGESGGTGSGYDYSRMGGNTSDSGYNFINELISGIREMVTQQKETKEVISQQKQEVTGADNLSPLNIVL